MTKLKLISYSAMLAAAGMAFSAVAAEANSNASPPAGMTLNALDFSGADSEVTFKTRTTIFLGTSASSPDAEAKNVISASDSANLAISADLGVYIGYTADAAPGTVNKTEINISGEEHSVYAEKRKRRRISQLC